MGDVCSFLSLRMPDKEPVPAALSPSSPHVRKWNTLPAGLCLEVLHAIPLLETCHLSFSMYLAQGLHKLIRGATPSDVPLYTLGPKVCKGLGLRGV